MEAYSKGVGELNKTIVCGHWHAPYGHYNLHHLGSGGFEKDSVFDTFKDEGIMALDACSAYSHKINVETIEEKRFINNLL